jgi:branched-chain amino acid transport system substrate-binding protein
VKIRSTKHLSLGLSSHSKEVLAIKSYQISQMSNVENKSPKTKPFRRKKMSKRIFAVLSLVIIASMILAACGQKGGDIKIAILAPLTGEVSTFGESTRDGALLAIDEWNAKGGVNGQKIVAVIADSQCSADPAMNAANKVIDQDGVKFIIGEVCSSASIPISQVANEKHVVQISPTSTNPKVTVDDSGVVKPYTFRACFIDPFQGTVGAKFALDNLKAKTAFIMFDQSNDYVRGLAEAFETAFTAGGGTVVGKEAYISTDTDFSTILAKVSEAKPDMIYLPSYYNVVNLVTAQAKEKGITAPFVGGDGWDSSDLDMVAAEGGYYTNHYSPDDTRQIVQDWLKNYGAKYTKDGAAVVPDALATLAYDATNLLIASIEKAKSDDPVKVKDAMAGITWDGVSGKISFDANHNPIKSAVILQVKDGKIVYVATVAP